MVKALRHQGSSIGGGCSAAQSKFNSKWPHALQHARHGSKTSKLRLLELEPKGGFYGNELKVLWTGCHSVDG